ncbi:hypothetical protein AAVH_29520 [Aphelenchoides avenae]|nr:hypothetical protein AAVH_29520 [Aphelenchus avenae]
MLVVPSDALDVLIRAFFAVYDFELDLYTVKCARTVSLPDMKISVGYGQNFFDYTVPAEKFVTKNTKTGLKCALLIVDGLGGWTIGSQFLPGRCAHLDYDQKIISFAVGK